MADASPTDQHLLLDLRVPLADAEIAADLLWRHGAQAVEETIENNGTVRLSTDFGADPLGAFASALRGERALEESARAWNAQVRGVDVSVADTWRDFVDDLVIADVRVRPSWKMPSDVASGDDATADEHLTVSIDPGGAFGMGDHPTTRGTLTLARACVGSTRPSTILDLGCGSGVLAIALVKDSRAVATAVDIARPAVEATRANAARNGVADRITVVLGDVRAVQGTFDLVLANILAPVLLADAADIVARITPQGTVVLSGFTDTRLDDIVAAYEALGCVPVERVQVDGWWSLQMQRGNQRLEVE